MLVMLISFPRWNGNNVRQKRTDFRLPYFCNSKNNLTEAGGGVHSVFPRSYYRSFNFILLYENDNISHLFNQIIPLNFNLIIQISNMTLRGKKLNLRSIFFFA